MIIYVIFLALILITGTLLNVDRKLRYTSHFLRIAFFMMICIVTLRGTSVGTDTYTYNKFFDEFTRLSFSEIFSINYALYYDVERAWALFNHIVGKIVGSFQFILLISSAVYFVGVYYYLKDIKRTGLLVVLTFIYNGLFIQSMNLTRQYTSMGLCLVGWHCLREKKKKEAIVFLILAFLIHTSAIIFIPFILLTQVKSFKLTRKITFLGVIGALVGVYFYDQIMPILFSIRGFVWYGKYANSYMDVEIGASRYIWLAELIITIAIYLYNRKNKIEKSGKVDNEVRMLMVIVYFVSCVLSTRFLLLARIGRYFQIATLGIYDDFCDLINIKMGKQTYMLVAFIFIIGLSSIFLLSVYSNLEQYSYSFFWQ